MVSATQAMNKETFELDIVTDNIWNNIDRTGGSRATKNMAEHYMLENREKYIR